MIYIESNRTVEAHSECILFLYLMDANGTPVPNVKMKIWAGPPPTGHPPYYQDEGPEDLNRRTDTNGKFQFIVANPTPTQPLDFFVQAIEQDDTPLSDPVHFPFPPHEARWVIITMTQESAPPRGGSDAASPVEIPYERRVQLEVGTATQSGADPINAGTALAATNKVTLEPPVSPKQLLRPKLFSHYMLLGPGSQPGTMTNLILALDYIIRYTPVVGFSPDEAKNAEHVTIVGDANALSTSLEQSLREAGCTVARISVSDSYALESAFKQLIDSGSPYPTQ